MNVHEFPSQEAKEPTQAEREEMQLMIEAAVHNVGIVLETDSPMKGVNYLNEVLEETKKLAGAKQLELPEDPVLRASILEFVRDEAISAADMALEAQLGEDYATGSTSIRHEQNTQALQNAAAEELEKKGLALPEDEEMKAAIVVYLREKTEADNGGNGIDRIAA